MLDNFKEHFSDRYQDVFNKTLVGKIIATFRFEKTLKFGTSVDRFKIDISNVQIRDVVNHVDRVIDPISDDTEQLLINNQKGPSFPIAELEKIQAGPLKPAMVYAEQVGKKMKTHVDAQILSEVVNAFANFDTGDLTTTVSTGVPITLSNTTIPQLISQAKAKLRSNNQEIGDLAWVTDSYAIAKIEQYHLSKDIETANTTFRNGFSGNIQGAKLFVSENLTGTAVLAMATDVTAGDTIAIGGVTFTAAAVPSSPGEFDVSGTADATRAIIANAINGAAEGKNSPTGYFEVSVANRALLNAKRITATNDNDNDILTCVGIGSGRLVVDETFTDGTDEWSKNYINSYFGIPHAVDVVMQQESDIKIKPAPFQNTDNIFITSVWGQKTFDDGSQQFLNVLIAS